MHRLILILRKLSTDGLWDHYHLTVIYENIVKYWPFHNPTDHEKSGHFSMIYAINPDVTMEEFLNI